MTLFWHRFDSYTPHQLWDAQNQSADVEILRSRDKDMGILPFHQFNLVVVVVTSFPLSITDIMIRFERKDGGSIPSEGAKFWD